MKVFLSWSGEVSLMVASLFTEMLPMMFEDVKPFLSSNIALPIKSDGSASCTVWPTVNSTGPN